MEENISQVTETPQVPLPSPVPEQAILKPLENKKYSPFLVIIMALVIILSLGTTVYFAYQNMKLQKEISVLQKKVPSPSPLIYSSPTPSIMPSSAVPGWKLYVNSNENYSFNYPSDWAVVPLKNNSDIIIDPVQAAASLQQKMSLGGGFGLDKHSAVIEFYTLPSSSNPDTLFVSNSSQTVTKTTVTVAGQNATQYTIKYLTDTPANTAGDIVYLTVVINKGNILALQISDSQYRQIYDQILSTFHFTQ